VNRDQVLSHLSEARDAIAQTVEDIRVTPDYDDSEYWVDMQHIYHHINTAWNSRNATVAEVDPVTDGRFNRWSQFPSDLPMIEVSR